jgi:hypothetical protein
MAHHTEGLRGRHAECFRYLKFSDTYCCHTVGREALLREKLSLDRCEFHIDEELDVSSISIYSHCTLPRRVEEFSYLLWKQLRRRFPVYGRNNISNPKPAASAGEPGVTLTTLIVLRSVPCAISGSPKDCGTGNGSCMRCVGARTNSLRE